MLDVTEDSFHLVTEALAFLNNRQGCSCSHGACGACLFLEEELFLNYSRLDLLLNNWFLILFLNHWVLEDFVDDRASVLFMYHLLVLLVNHWLDLLMNDFLVLLMDDWLMNLTNLFFVNDGLVVLVDDVLVVLMNHILMMLMDDVLMMLVDNIFVVLLNDRGVDVGLYSHRFDVCLNGGGYRMLFIESSLLMSDDFGILLESLLDYWGSGCEVGGGS
jgi:hypothetical protein